MPCCPAGSDDLASGTAGRLAADVAAGLVEGVLIAGRRFGPFGRGRLRSSVGPVRSDPIRDLGLWPLIRRIVRSLVRLLSMK